MVMLVDDLAILAAAQAAAASAAAASAATAGAGAAAGGAAAAGAGAAGAAGSLAGGAGALGTLGTSGAGALGAGGLGAGGAGAIGAPALTALPAGGMTATGTIAPGSAAFGVNPAAVGAFNPAMMGSQIGATAQGGGGLFGGAQGAIQGVGANLKAGLSNMGSQIGGLFGSGAPQALPAGGMQATGSLTGQGVGAFSPGASGQGLINAGQVQPLFGTPDGNGLGGLMDVGSKSGFDATQGIGQAGQQGGSWMSNNSDRMVRAGLNMARSSQNQQQQQPQPTAQARPIYQGQAEPIARKPQSMDELRRRRLELMMRGQ